MRTHPSHKSQFPDLNLLDDESKRTKYENDLSELSKAEQKKFSYIPPVTPPNFASRRLFWSAKLEVAGRLLIFISAILTLVIAYVLGKFGILTSIENLVETPIIFFGMDMSNLITYGLLYLALICSLVYILPMILIRTVGGIKRWSVIYISFAVLYFIFFELICATLIVINSINFSTVGGTEINKIFPIIIVLILAKTVIQIVGSCFLIVKADDIKQRMNIEV